jgi:hypothetical protein
MRGRAERTEGSQGARHRPQHRISIICATIAYPALENLVQKSMIFISELTKRTYRFKKNHVPEHILKFI